MSLVFYFCCVHVCILLPEFSKIIFYLFFCLHFTYTLFFNLYIYFICNVFLPVISTIFAHYLSSNNFVNLDILNVILFVLLFYFLFVFFSGTLDLETDLRWNSQVLYEVHVLCGDRSHHWCLRESQQLSQVELWRQQVEVSSPKYQSVIGWIFPVRWSVKCFIWA